jgi:hypothetical protein
LKMDETVVISSDESSDDRDPPLPEKKGFVLKRVQTDEEWFSKVELWFFKIVEHSFWRVALIGIYVQ